MARARTEQEHPWWRSGVIYEVYPRSFQDSDGDGVGDLRGITSRLDYLAWLGVGVIWLPPFYPSPMADFGYDVADYTGVDPLFGTLDDFDDLVAEAHRRDIRIVVDFVPNHSSDEHPWFVESRSSRGNPKRDWYYWRDGKPDGSPPNNWLSMFGGSTWEWDEKTRQYYLHSFLNKQPDLNWRNEEVKEAMFDAMRFWLDRGVDGLRVDMAHAIMKEPDLRDNPPNPTAGGLHKPMGDYDKQLHVHDIGHPDVHAVNRQMRKLLDSYGTERPRMAMGEIHIFDWPRWASYYGEKLDEYHLPLNFGLMVGDWSAENVRSVVDAVEDALPDGAWPNWVLGNHDEVRVASRVGSEQARVAMLLLLTLRGTPTLYYGDEIGMENVEVPPEKAQDPWGKNLPELGLGRDPFRTPMRWDASENAGFCPEGIEPWLPVGGDLDRINVAAQSQDPGSLLALTRTLIHLRRAVMALSSGDYRPLDEVPQDCFVYERSDGGTRYLIALNFCGERRALHARDFAGARITISTHMDREGRVGAEPFVLRANEGCVLEQGE